MSYSSPRNYPLEKQLQAWTRIDMLLALYDRTISAVEGLREAKQSSQTTRYAEKLLDTQKYLLGLHAGLKPEESEVAFNIARLIHFVATQIDLGQYDAAIQILESTRNGFEAIREEAAKLEKEGQIPSLESSQSFTTVV